MDVHFVNPFIKATLNVLHTMARIEPKMGKPFIKIGKRSKGDFTGMIGLVGSQTKGSFAISFEERCIKRIVINMLGVECLETNNDILDAVGELTNMISGGARADLAKQGLDFEMAIPMIVSGKGHEIAHVTEHPIIVVPFETEEGLFFIEASLK